MGRTRDHADIPVRVNGGIIDVDNIAGGQIDIISMPPVVIDGVIFPPEVVFPSTAISAFGELETVSPLPHVAWKFPYNINTDLYITTVANGGTVTQNIGRAVLSTGVAAGGSAEIKTRRRIRYVPGVGVMIRFTAVFDTPLPNTKQIIGYGNTQDGFFFGYDGEDFGILRRVGGVDFWTYSAAWNKEVYTPNFVDVGNVFEIKMQWLGYGPVDFFIETPDKEMKIVHRIPYPATSEFTTINNPALPLYAYVNNTAGGNDIVLKTPSAVGFMEGPRIEPNLPFSLTQPRAFSGAKNILAATETPILSIRMPSTYLGFANREEGLLKAISVATDGTKSVQVHITKNVATLTGAVWTNYGTSVSALQYDTTATSFTGGSRFASYAIGKSEGKYFDIGDIGLVFRDGDTYTISAYSANASTIDIDTIVTEFF